MVAPAVGRVAVVDPRPVGGRYADSPAPGADDGHPGVRDRNSVAGVQGYGCDRASILREPPSGHRLLGRQGGVQGIAFRGDPRLKVGNLRGRDVGDVRDVYLDIRLVRVVREGLPDAVEVYATAATATAADSTGGKPAGNPKVVVGCLEGDIPVRVQHKERFPLKGGHAVCEVVELVRLDIAGKVYIGSVLLGLDATDRLAGRLLRGLRFRPGLFLAVAEGDLVGGNCGLSLVDGHGVHQDGFGTLADDVCIGKKEILSRADGAVVLHHKFRVNFRGILPPLDRRVRKEFLGGGQEFLLGHLHIDAGHRDVKENELVAGVLVGLPGIFKSANGIVRVREPLGEGFVLGAPAFQIPAVVRGIVLHGVDGERPPGAFAGTHRDGLAVSESRLLVDVEADLPDRNVEELLAVVLQGEPSIAACCVSAGLVRGLRCHIDRDVYIYDVRNSTYGHLFGNHLLPGEEDDSVPVWGQFVTA